MARTISAILREHLQLAVRFPPVFILFIVGLAACDTGGSADTDSTQAAVMLAQGDAPNVVVVVLDDWGWKDYGAVTPGILTPNIDAIAANGFVFDNAFLTTSSCSPSRASILMGRYPSATGAPHLHDVVTAGFTSIPQQLRRVGFHTESVGKWHLGNPFVARFDKVRQSRADGSEERWVEALRERPLDKPFFFWLSAFDPHVPHDAPEAFRVHAPDEVALPPYLADAPATRQAYAAYLDEIHRVDFYIGQVIDELQAQGVLHNTWLIVMADNGAPTLFAKTTLYDSGIKTPLLVLGPPGRGRYSGLVSAVDLAPTLLDLVGLPSPEDFQGRSFASAFTDASYEHRQYIFAEQNNHGLLISRTAVRSLDHLLIRNHYAEVYCMAEMQPLWRDLLQLQKVGGATAQQSLCLNPPQPNTTEFYVVDGEGYEVADRAGAARHAVVQQEMERLLDEWQRAYRQGACATIECARAGAQQQ